MRIWSCEWSDISAAQASWKCSRTWLWTAGKSAEKLISVDKDGGAGRVSVNPPGQQVIWGDIWKQTVEKSQQVTRMGDPGSGSGSGSGTRKESACASATCLKYTLCVYNFIFLVTCRRVIISLLPESFTTYDIKSYNSISVWTWSQTPLSRYISLSFLKHRTS